MLERHTGVSVNRQRQTAKNVAAGRTVKERSVLVYKRTKNLGTITQGGATLKGSGLRKNIRTS